jgi:hypothetical protein
MMPKIWSKTFSINPIGHITVMQLDFGKGLAVL